MDRAYSKLRFFSSLCTLYVLSPGILINFFNSIYSQNLKRGVQMIGNKNYKSPPSILSNLGKYGFYQFLNMCQVKCIKK